MSRSRKSDDGVFDAFFDFLRIAPSWVGLAIVFAVFVGMYWVVPWLWDIAEIDASLTESFIRGLSIGTRLSAPFVAGALLFVWIVIEVIKRRDRRRLDAQESIETIRRLSWREFELLLAEAFRLQGYAVEDCGKNGPDGGVDLRLRRGGECTLVQCKHWKRNDVGVKVVRELLGVVTSEGATSGIVVATGAFTPDAREFARSNPLNLIDGSNLMPLIRGVQPRPSPKTHPATDGIADSLCPVCNSPMKIRTAKKGLQAGAQFWGCSRYPKCLGKRNVSSLTRST